MPLATDPATRGYIDQLKEDCDAALADVARLEAERDDLVEALSRIRIAAEFHAQGGISDEVRRYAHDSTKRLADKALAKYTEASDD